MKKILLFIFLSFTSFLFSQVSTVPTIPTANNPVTITFNATGSELDGYSGDVYAHTGLITSTSTSNTDWKYVKGSWGNNTTQPKLTKTGTNTFELQITPNITTYYNVTGGETITKIAIVLRSSDGAKQSRPDIFIPIYAAGLNIAFTNPANNSAFNLNSTITISAEASLASNLELFIDGVSIKTALNATTISTSYLLTAAGNHILKAVATNGTEVKETTINIFVKTPTVNATKPVGLKYGINKNIDNSVTFLLKAPLKNDVLILGDFNNWTLNATYQMKKDGEDFWLTLPGLDINTEYAYQYFIDYSIKVADPYSEKILDPSNDQYISANYPNLKAYPVNLATGNVSTFKINRENYVWNTPNFIKPAQSNLIIYELLIRDFTASSSFNEAITKLDYLASLGVNAIELMPVNEFEGNDSWGYNPSFYMALDKAYGTKNDFKKFVDACHQRGIAVLADVVFNHSYSQSPLLQMYWDSANNKPAANNPWYNVNHNLVDNTNAHWGYDFNHESPHTKAFFKDVLSYWMDEYKIDGFRFDFTKGFSNTIYTGADNWASAYDASRITILKNYADHVWSNKPTNKPYVIFEHLSDNSEETELANYGIMLWGNMNHSYNQNTMGFPTDTNINWISYKQRGWNFPNVVGYMESHDEERLMYKNLQFGNSNATYNVKNLNTALSRQELAGMFFFTIPGPKMVWQFGELGYDFSINTCSDGTVSNNCRLSKKPIRWDYFDNTYRKQVHNTWATMIAFKKKYPEVFNTTDFSLNVGTLTKSILLKNTSFDVAIVGNFDITSKTITATFSKTGTWYEYFTGEEKNITNTSTAITLNPGEYKLYSTVKLLDPRGGTASDDSDGDNVVDTEDLCPNTPAGAAVNSTGCPIFTLPANNFNVEVISETCPGKNNGQIKITAVSALNYTTTINGVNYNFTSTTSTSANLAPGTYNFCIGVTGQTYTQCYTVQVAQGATVSGKSSVASGKASVEIEKGTAPFTVFVNGLEQFETSSPIFSVDVKGGDILEVKTAVSCEGIYAKTIDGIDGVFAYPNPTQGAFEITVPTSEKEVVVELYNFNSQLISAKKYPVVYGKVQLSLANKPTGVYIAKVLLDQPVTLKIIKQ